MKTYLIQRNVPGAGNLSAGDKKAIAIKSCKVIAELGPQIEWDHSYITKDNLWCIYRAEAEDILHEHARRGNFPINAVHEIKGTFSPATAELPVLA
jgi:hypothetical protein